ncbi:MAG: hypothetical protein AAF741_15765 [Bacteroidota bacterium]
MKISRSLTFTGIALLLAGLVILGAETIGIRTAKFLVPTLFILGGASSIQSSMPFSEANTFEKYHLFQGVGFIVFGLIFALYARSLDDFLSHSTYFILIFGMIEIILSFAIVNLGINFKWGNLIPRFISGFLGLIGGVLILATSATDQMSGLTIVGVFTSTIGLGITFFSLKTNTNN